MIGTIDQSDRLLDHYPLMYLTIYNYNAKNLNLNYTKLL